MILRQWVNFCLIGPVVDHNGLGNFLALETLHDRLHQIATDCNHKIAALAAKLIEPHHSIGNQLTFGIANSQHLLRVKVLNVVDVLRAFHPFPPYTPQTAQDRRLRDREHIVHLTNFKSCAHCTKKIR